MLRGALVRGTCAAAAAAAAAYALARWGFHRLYYLGVFLPSFAFLFLLVAWLLHLKDDGFFRAPKRAEKKAEARLGLFAPTEGLVQGERGEARPRDPDPAAGRRAMAALLVAAAELAALAAALYALAGVGASYY